MPKQKIDYSKTEIYKLIHKDDIDNENIYIGSTTNFRLRKCCHKSNSTNEKRKEYTFKVYENIRNNGGWTEWKMLLVEKYPCIDKKEADVRERYWIDFYKSQLNIVIPGRTHKEWYNNNKEEFAKKCKIYYNNKKKEILEKVKIYSQNNKEKLAEYQKEYNENHKKEISEKRKEKVTCECGCVIRKSNIEQHKRTQKHLDLMLLKI